MIPSLPTQLIWSMAEFFEDIAQAIAIVIVRFGFDQPIKDFSAREIAYSQANERKLNCTRKNSITMPEEGHISGDYFK